MKPEPISTFFHFWPPGATGCHWVPGGKAPISPPAVRRSEAVIAEIHFENRHRMAAPSGLKGRCIVPESSYLEISAFVLQTGEPENICVENRKFTGCEWNIRLHTLRSQGGSPGKNKDSKIQQASIMNLWKRSDFGGGTVPRARNSVFKYVGCKVQLDRQLICQARALITGATVHKLGGLILAYEAYPPGSQRSLMLESVLRDFIRTRQLSIALKNRIEGQRTIADKLSAKSAALNRRIEKLLSQLSD
jgi:hypothetical protein